MKPAARLGLPLGSSETRTSIGRRCTGSDVLSRALLIARGFPWRALPLSAASRDSFPVPQGPYFPPVCVGAVRCVRVCAPAYMLCCEVLSGPGMSYVIKVAMVPGFHLFPFRTEKLSPAAPMVLPQPVGE